MLLIPAVAAHRIWTRRAFGAADGLWIGGALALPLAVLAIVRSAIPAANDYSSVGVVTWVVTLLLVVVGALTFTKLSRLEDPEFTIKDAVVTTAYPGASAEEGHQPAPGRGGGGRQAEHAGPQAAATTSSRVTAAAMRIFP